MKPLALAVLSAVLSVLAPGSFVIDMSSSDPMRTRALAETVAKAGSTLVDAPVSGAVRRARDGRIVLVEIKCVGRGKWDRSAGRVSTALTGGAVVALTPRVYASVQLQLTHELFVKTCPAEAARGVARSSTDLGNSAHEHGVTERDGSYSRNPQLLHGGAPAAASAVLQWRPSPQLELLATSI